MQVNIFKVDLNLGIKIDKHICLSVFPLKKHSNNFDSNFCYKISIRHTQDCRHGIKVWQSALAIGVVVVVVGCGGAVIIFEAMGDNNE
jgi:hypothetical protein